MAASYSTGTASNPTDLLQSLVAWLVTQGWTNDQSTSDGSGWRAHLHKGSVYMNFRSAMNETIFPSIQLAASYGIGLYGGSGFGGGAWNEQAGGPIRDGGTETVGAFCRLDSGEITGYRFFDDGSDNVVAVIERAGSVYTHLGFGTSIFKRGTFTGGNYFYSATSSRYADTDNINGDLNNHAGAPLAISHLMDTTAGTEYGYAGFVRADVDGFTGKWIGLSSISTSGVNGYTGKRGHSGISYIQGLDVAPDAIPNFERIHKRLVSNFNAQAVLFPVRLFAERDAGGWSLLGRLPSVFVTSAVAGGFAHGSIYALDGNDYMLFPNFAVQKFA